MPVKEILTKKYLKVKPEDTISQMVGRMRKQRQHQAFVFDGNKYLGMIDRKFLLTSRIDPSKMKVGNVVKKRSKAKTQFYVPIISPDTEISEAARLMAAAGVHMLPVEEKGKMTGAVRALDIAAQLADEYKSVACSELASMRIEKMRYDQEIGRALEILNNMPTKLKTTKIFLITKLLPY